MLSGEKQGNAMVFNESNHCEKGNPHPQSFELPSYKTGFKSGSTKQFVKIFDEDFQTFGAKGKLLDYNRGFSSVYCKMLVYDLFSDNLYSTFDLDFYIFLKNDGTTLQNNAYVNKRFGLFDMDCRIYTLKSTGTAPDGTSYTNYNVKIYISSTNAGGRFYIRPQVYHSPESSIQNPLKVKANSQGFNSYEQLQDLFKDLGNAVFEDDSTITSTLSNYTLNTYTTTNITNSGTKIEIGNGTSAVANAVSFPKPHSKIPSITINVSDNNANYLVEPYNITPTSFNYVIRKNSAGQFNSTIATTETINLVWRSTE